MISLIEIYKNGEHNVLVQNREKNVTRLFYTCAAIVPLENGDIDKLVTRAVRELLGNPQSNVQNPLPIEQMFNFLRSRIRIIHKEDAPCNCSEIIERIIHSDVIETYPELYEYTEKLREAFEEHPDFVCSSDLKTQIIGTIDHLVCYGPKYQERLESIALEEGQVFVAYEYFDEDEGIFKIQTLGDTGELVKEYPAFDVCRSLLQHGILGAKDGLDPCNYKGKGIFY